MVGERREGGREVGEKVSVITYGLPFFIVLSPDLPFSLPWPDQSGALHCARAA